MLGGAVVWHWSFLSATSLLSLPEWTKRAILAAWEVQPFFMRAAHVAITHRHGLDAVLVKEIFHFLLDLRVGRNARGDPTLDDGLGPVMKDHASSDFCGRLVVWAVEGHGADGVLRRLLLLAVLHLVLLDGRIPLSQIRIGEKLLVVLGDEPASFLVSVDDGWVQTCRLHRFDRHVLDLLRVRHVEEDGIIWSRLMPIFLDELLPLFFEQIDHFLGHRDGLEDRAVLSLFVVEALTVAAVLVFLSAAAGTAC